MFTLAAQRQLPNLVIASPRDEQEIHPVAVRSTWPRCRSPCTLAHRGLGAVGDRFVDPAQALGVLGELGHHVDGGVQALAHLPGHGGVPVAVGRLGGQHGGHVLVHRRRRRTQPLAVGGEVAAHLVGVQVAIGVQVAGAGGASASRRRSCGRRRLTIPSVGGSSPVGVGDLDGAEQAVRRVAFSPAQHLVELEIGVEAGRQPAEHLEHRRRVEDERVLLARSRRMSPGRRSREVGPPAGWKRTGRRSRRHQVDQPRDGACRSCSAS